MGVSTKILGHRKYIRPAWVEKTRRQLFVNSSFYIFMQQDHPARAGDLLRNRCYQKLARWAKMQRFLAQFTVSLSAQSCSPRKGESAQNDRVEGSVGNGGPKNVQTPVLR